jgi:hypothetical protein
MDRDCCTAPSDDADAAPQALRCDLLPAGQGSGVALTIRNQDAHHFSRARTRIWELAEALHCSVIGTCLSTAELRKVLTKLGVAHPGESDHELHRRGVSLAGQNGTAAKLLTKTLDSRHDLSVRQFGRAKSDSEVRSLWDDALRRGDIPGPYWAVLTHPATSYRLRCDAFEHVHMLSHLVGAANRADIRRLGELETAQAALEETVARQQHQLHAALTARDAAICKLQKAQLESLREPVPVPAAADAEEARLQGAVAELERRLECETARRVSLEERLARTDVALDRERRSHADALAREAALGAELAAAEASLRGPAASTYGEAPTLSLDGVALLLVGGRPHQVAHLRLLAERHGATLAHHDGGIEDQSGMLAGLMGRADLVLFPVDCVSHEAALAVKRACRQTGKGYIPLRTAGQGSFLAALAEWSRKSRDDSKAA